MTAHLFNALRFALCTIGLCCIGICTAVEASEWPHIAMPPGVTAFAVGEQITFNGLPMRVQGFVAKDQSVNSLALWFKRSLGQPLVENKRDNKLVLGRAEDGYYLSIQLEPLPPDGHGGSKGLLAVSDLTALGRHRDADATSAQRWLERWPSGTQLLTRMAAQDNGKTSLHVAMRNGHSTSLNRDALIAVMKEDGLVLVQESGTATAANAPAALHDAKAFFFKGQGKEGVATIARDDQGQTNLVLNTTADLETFHR